MKLKSEFEYPKCSICGRRAVVKKRGLFLCELHKNIEPYVRSYSAKNKNKRYKSKKKVRTISFEFETAYVPPEVWKLKLFDFLPTGDGSIPGIEWKSPIVPANRVCYLLRIIEGIEKRAGKLLDSSCGTHIHIGLKESEIEKLWKNRQIFIPLKDYLEEHSIETGKIWGRSHSSWASLNSDFRHGSFLNLRTSTRHTIEWRLPKWKSRKQFQNIVKIVLKLTEYALQLLEHYPAESAGRFLLDYYKKLIQKPNASIPTIAKSEKSVIRGIALKEVVR